MHEKLTVRKLMYTYAHHEHVGTIPTKSLHVRMYQLPDNVVKGTLKECTQQGVYIPNYVCYKNTSKI